MPQVRICTYSLRPAQIDNAKPREKPFTLTDGGGLHVEVMPGGSKVWRWKYYLDGKREKVTLGHYPAMGIKAARQRHQQLREVLARGESPAGHKQATAAAQRQAEAGAVLFRDFAARWLIDAMGHLSESYQAATRRQLDVYVYPRIGDKPIADVLPADVLAIVEALRHVPPTAEIVRSTLQRVFNHGIRKLVITSNPATAMRGVVVVPPKQHHRHLNERELGAFWRALGQQSAHIVTVMAARLLMLTMARKGELLRARWREFDLDAATWDVPAERMKMRRPHRVYLSRQALVWLRALQPISGGGGPDGFVLPSVLRPKVPLGDATLNHLFKRMEFLVPDFSPHGTRGTAATLLREHGFGRDVVELLLAHKEKDATAAAYHHHELADERRRALQFLADRVDALASRL